MKGLCALWLAVGMALGAMPPDFVNPEPPGTAQGELKGALDALSLPNLSEHLAWLADPRREGRGLGTRGLDAAGRELAGRLKRAGLGPLGAGYFQAVPLREYRKLGGTLTLTVGGRRFRWTQGQGLLLPPLSPRTLDLPLVEVGFGIHAPEVGHDDFKGVDVKGKAVLLRLGLPEGEVGQREALRRKWAGPVGERARLDGLEARGARLVIILDPDFRETLRRPRADSVFEAAQGPGATEEPVLVRLDAAQAVDLVARGPEDARAVLRLSGQLRSAASRNVLALLPGKDPEAGALVVGAHLDHLGRPGGVVHPGADDNASGVSALAEIARVLAAPGRRPRRTLIFAFWTGEEEGKFGSEHYLRHPRWPLARTRAYLNLDMIGHAWQPESLAQLLREGGIAAPRHLDPATFAEPGYADWAPELGEALARAGLASGMSLHLDPGSGVNGGSDYRGFARRRIPWVRFFGDFFPGYHTPEDSAAKLDAGQVHRMARLVLATIWELAY